MGSDGQQEQLDIKQIDAPDTHITHYLARSTHTRDTIVTLYEGTTKKLLDDVEELFTASTQETLLAPPHHEPGDGHMH